MVGDGRVAHVSSFLDVRLFPVFGLPLWFDEHGTPMTTEPPEGLNPPV